MSYNVEFYQKKNGTIPVLDFLKSLQPKLQAKAFSEIKLLEECGPNLHEPYVKSIKGNKYQGLWELRVKFASDIARVFYFTIENNTFVLLHGFQKKTNATPARELERALNYRDDYLRRSI